MTELDKTQYRKDAKGNLVAIENIREIDLLRDELVQEIAARACAVQDNIREFRDRAMDDITAFVDLSAERYGVKLGGVRGNITLHSFDGNWRVQLAISDTLTFDEGLHAAKALIDECINEWTIGSRAEIKALINNAFAVDKEGKISTTRVLGLRRLNISDEKWQRAMDALSDSLQVHTSKSYVRVYQRVQNTDSYRLLTGDMARGAK